MKNDTTKFFDGAKVSRARQLHQLHEEENHFMDGLLGTPNLLGGASCWFIIATIIVWASDYNLAAKITIGIGALFVLVWVSINVFPRVWKWLINLV